MEKKKVVERNALFSKLNILVKFPIGNNVFRNDVSRAAPLKWIRKVVRFETPWKMQQRNANKTQGKMSAKLRKFQKTTSVGKSHVQNKFPINFSVRLKA